MDNLQILIASLISFLGFGAGIIVYFFTKKEVQQGKQYLKLFTAGIMLMFSAYLFNNLGIALLVRVILYTILVAVLAFVNIPVQIAYLILGAGLGLFAANDTLFFTGAALIFAYGLAAGSMEAEAAARKHYKRNGKLAGYLIATAKNGLFFLPILLFILWNACKDILFIQ
jgi:hypothetical protein